MEFLFLPPIYLITLLASGVITGLTFDYLNQKPFIVASGTLFGIFTVSQLVYRFLDNAQPERLVGQFIYYLIFLVVIYTTRVLKDKFIAG
jgi:hypothetical protein